VISDEDVRQLLRRFWGLAESTHVARHDGGMGSQTWIVNHGGRRWVAKSVAPHLADSFAHGLEVARLLDDAGIRSGAPAPALSGSMTVDTASGDRVALLTWVPGSPLTGTDEAEQRLIGDTLARVHRVLRNREVPGAQRFHWVDPAAAHLELRPWLRPAVTAAVDALTALQARERAWPQGLLHADPAPEAFRLDPASAQCAIIDWGSALYGPLLYDLASAVMYLGGPTSAAAMIDAYQAAPLLSGREIADGLPVMLRFRWGVQADYFAWRITANDLTGITGPEENEKGLEDARLALLESSPSHCVLPSSR
jgi:Ser/Thr protein kinase RdoA (MazF antagonist)